MGAKKGIVAINIMIVFIAIIIIAVIASSFFIYRANIFADRAHQMTKDSTRDTLSCLQIVEIAGYDGNDQQLTIYTLDAKIMGACRQPLFLDDLTLSFGDGDYKTLLKYRDGPIVNNNSGYNTWQPQEYGEIKNYEKQLSFAVDVIDNVVPYSLPIDLDDDGLTDYVYTCDNTNCPSGYDGTHLKFVLSSQTTPEYLELRNDDGQLINISGGLPKTLNITRAKITNGWGEMSLYGNVSVAYEIGWGNPNVTIYHKPELIDADLDDDGQNDHVAINNTHVIFFISGEPQTITIPLGADLSSTPASINLNKKIISNNGNELGRITISGTTNTPETIEEGMTFKITPYLDAHGYYVIEYLQKGSHPLKGALVPGDVVRFYFEGYRPTGVTETMHFIFYTSSQESIPKGVYVGDTIPAAEKVILYPDV